MNKYRVPVRLVFTGTVDVIAEDDGEAEDIVLDNFGGILDHAENNLRDEITDWDMSIHSDTERDEDEEVELIEEDIDEDEDDDEDEDEEDDDE